MQGSEALLCTSSSPPSICYGYVVHLLVCFDETLEREGPSPQFLKSGSGKTYLCRFRKRYISVLTTKRWGWWGEGGMVVTWTLSVPPLNTPL